ncbi:N-acetylmuramoyl-L-alanine amidase [Stackebrandtia soli]|uniref:peptidoglycan recognition protein family protein n=1 Tax=Stackebrandtia soli TaxID=1892856 RepID=UPI0039EA558E
MTQWTRRNVLVGGTALTGAALAIGTPSAAHAAVTPPTIHSRAAWNARPPSGTLTINNYRPTVIVVHHMATPNTSDTSLAAAYAMSRSRQNYHMDGRGYSDVGDHFGNSRGGHITEGRAHSLPLLQEGGSRFVLGAHAAGGNTNSIGIENEGLYTDVAPPTAQYNSLVHLCAYICQQYQISPSTSSIIGHRQVTATACPGNVLFGMLPQLRADVATMLGTTPPPTDPQWPTVRQGDTGHNVRSIQYFLNHRGIATSVDGNFGPATAGSVRSFQSANGLGADGVVGPLTWPKLVVTTQQGSTGDATRAVQSQLTRHGYATTVDGNFGPQTATNVRSFQSARGIGVDGQAGPQTWRRFTA